MNDVTTSETCTWRCDGCGYNNPNDSEYCVMCTHPSPHHEFSYNKPPLDLLGA